MFSNYQVSAAMKVKLWPVHVFAKYNNLKDFTYLSHLQE